VVIGRWFAGFVFLISTLTPGQWPGVRSDDVSVLFADIGRFDATDDPSRAREEAVSVVWYGNFDPREGFGDMRGDLRVCDKGLSRIPASALGQWPQGKVWRCAPEGRGVVLI